MENLYCLTPAQRQWMQPSSPERAEEGPKWRDKKTLRFCNYRNQPITANARIFISYKETNNYLQQRNQHTDKCKMPLYVTNLAVNIEY